MSLSFPYKVIILVLFTSSVQAWNCYLPNAVGFDNVGMKPCNTTLADTAEGSACCDPKDSCSTSGMCLGRSGYVYRGGCTDSTFGSENCPSYCLTDPILKTKYKKNTNIYSCGTEGMFSANFCCESFISPPQSCCGSSTFIFPGSGLAFPPGHDAELALISSASGAITTTTVTAARVTVTATVEGLVSAITTTDGSGDTITSSSTSVATAVDGKTSKSSQTSASKSNSSDLGMVIGAGVGIPLGCIALGILGLLLWRERRLRKLDAAPPIATCPVPLQSVASRKSEYMATTRSVDDEKMVEQDAQGWEQQAMQLDGRSVYATHQPGRHELMGNGR